MVSGGCFIVIVLGPLSGRYFAVEYAWASHSWVPSLEDTLPMSACAGLSSFGCFAAKVALTLSGECLATVVAGSHCGYLSSSLLGPLSSRYFDVKRVRASHLVDTFPSRLL